MARTRTLVIGSLMLTLFATAVWAQPPSRKTKRPRIRQGQLKAGDAAPDLSLQDLEGKRTVKLSEMRGKPVVLIFGSCTCPPFVRTTRSTDALYAAYKDRVHFYLVYIREAHPTDGRAIRNNRFQVKSPTSLEERRKIARDFAEEMDVSIPILVDTIDDRVQRAYSCWPNRMVIVDAEGKIADPGAAGPGGVRGSLKTAPEVLDKLLSATE